MEHKNINTDQLIEDAFYDEMDKLAATLKITQSAAKFLRNLANKAKNVSKKVDKAADKVDDIKIKVNKPVKVTKRQGRPYKKSVSEMAKETVDKVKDTVSTAVDRSKKSVKNLAKRIKFQKPISVEKGTQKVKETAKKVSKEAPKTKKTSKNTPKTKKVKANTKKNFKKNQKAEAKASDAKKVLTIATVGAGAGAGAGMIANERSKAASVMDKLAKKVKLDTKDDSMWSDSGGVSLKGYETMYNMDPGSLAIDTLSYNGPSNFEFKLQGKKDGKDFGGTIKQTATAIGKKVPTPRESAIEEEKEQAEKDRIAQAKADGTYDPFDNDFFKKNRSNFFNK